MQYSLFAYFNSPELAQKACCKKPEIKDEIVVKPNYYIVC